MNKPDFLPSQMRAMEITEGTLRPVFFPLPMPKADEVLIRVHYTGLNRADMMQRDGHYPPPEDASPLPGLEVSGTIAALGNGVLGWDVGEEVCALLNGGGYAEYVAVPAAQVLPIPHVLTLQEAVTLPEAAATAIMALRHEANLQAGERVLIHGGSSGVGLILGQTARAWGGEVYATAAGARKSTFIETLDLHAIDHITTNYGAKVLELTDNEGVDVIIDILGGPELATHLKLLRRGGRMVCLAMLEGSVVEQAKIGGILMKNLRISGATLRTRNALQKAAIMQDVHDHLWPHLANGRIRPVIDSIFPLEEAEKAMQRMQERLHCGKILLEVAAN